ncbi:MAG: CoA pyrophosphatase [Arenicellales bacterium]
MRKEEISSRLSAHEPRLLNLENNRHGAVAMILRPGEDGKEVLFIERTRVDSDPWSGQMAFPGGIVEADDPDARGAAERETLEEVGIDLTAATYMGRLDDVQGRHRAHRSGIVVSGFVYFDSNRQRTVPNYEVADIVWEPLATFMDSGRFAYAKYPPAPDERFPGVRVGRRDHQIVWGLTRRFLMSFFQILGQPFLVDAEYVQSIPTESD